MEDNSEYKLNILLPASIVLFGIGLLTLMTPLMTNLSKRSLILDVVSGGVLVLLGIVGFVVRKFQPDAKS